MCFITFFKYLNIEILSPQSFLKNSLLYFMKKIICTFSKKVFILIKTLQNLVNVDSAITYKHS